MRKRWTRRAGATTVGFMQISASVGGCIGGSSQHPISCSGQKTLSLRLVRQDHGRLGPRTLTAVGECSACISTCNAILLPHQTQRCSFARPQYRNADSTMRASQPPLRNYLAHRAATATESEAGQRSAFLSTAIAGDGERSFAFAVMLVSTVVFVAAAPFARVPLSQLWAFIPIYQSALALNDLITAVLLFAQLGYCARARCLLSPVDTSSPLAWSLCIRSVFLVCFHRQGCSAPVPRPPPGSTCTGAPSRFS